MKILGILLLTIISNLISCKKSNPDAILNEACQQIVILDQGQFTDVRVDDHTILEATIDDQDLQIKIQYGGGCGDIMTSLVTNGLFMESFPVQLALKMSFIDEDDCKALVQEDVCFNLSEIEALYKQDYQTDNGTIILRLEGYEDRLDFTF